MAGKWSYENTKKFVLEYVKHECLWKNNYSPYFRDKQVCLAAYRSIAQAMDMPDCGVPEVRNKIKNLRSTYKQEMKKTEESKFSRNPYKSNIKWLIDLAPVFNYKPRRKTKPLKNNICDESLQLLQEHKSNEDENCEIQTRDESDVFGENVAMQLKKMSQEKALLAKCKIQTILTEYGIADLKERNSDIAMEKNNESLFSSITDIKSHENRANCEPTSSIAENNSLVQHDNNIIMKYEEDSLDLETCE